MDLGFVRFFDPTTGGRLRRVYHEILSIPYVDVPWDMSPDEFVKLTQPLVTAREIDPRTGEPTQRWVTDPLEEIFHLPEDARQKLARLLTKANYVAPIMDLNDLFNVPVDPSNRSKKAPVGFGCGGRARSVRIKISEMIRKWKEGVRPEKFVLIGNRARDRHGKDVVEDFYDIQTKYGLEPPEGCESYREGTILPTEADLPVAEGYERWMMQWFMEHLQMPASMRNVPVVYEDSLEVYFEKNPDSIDAVFYTIQPHRFHRPKFLRTAPRGSRVALIAPSAILARYDVSYLADALGREILETYFQSLRDLGIEIDPKAILRRLRREGISLRMRY